MPLPASGSGFLFPNVIEKAFTLNGSLAGRRSTMATYHALAATSRAILGLLEDARDTYVDEPASPQNAPPSFALFHAAHYDTPPVSFDIKLGVSLYLYRVAPNTSMRNAPRRMGNDGRTYGAPLLVDLYYLLTAWSDDVERQQRLLGWSMRVLHDMPILPAAYINAHMNIDVMEMNESVELTPDPLSFQDMTTLWDKLKPKMQSSVAYIARMVRIDSTVEATPPIHVQTREYRFDGMQREAVR